MTEISEFSGWVAIAYIVVKDLLIPLAKKQIPAKQKQEDKKLEHAQVMEEKRLDAELEVSKKLADAVTGIEKNLVVSNERLSRIETDIKDIKDIVKPKRSRKVN